MISILGLSTVVLPPWVTMADWESAGTSFCKAADGWHNSDDPDSKYNTLRCYKFMQIN